MKEHSFKKWNQNFAFRIIILVAVILGIVFCVMPRPAQAATKQASTPGEACKSGKYIYYAYEMGGVRMGIMRLDTKTMKKKEIVDYKINGKETNGFYDITVKGNYIYATWDQNYGTGSQRNYIYRFDKSGKSKKKLAVGSCPVIVGNYIYYIQEKVSSEYNNEATIQTGKIYRMKLNGTHKSKVKNVGKSTYINDLYQYGKSVLYSKNWNSEKLYTLNGKKIYSTNLNLNFTKNMVWDSDNSMYVKNAGYRYYIKEQGYPYRHLYRENLKTGKSKKIATFNNIQEFRVCGDYIMVKDAMKNGKNGLYCVDVTKKLKKRLHSWIPAE